MRLLARNESLEQWFRNWLGVKLCLHARDHAKGQQAEGKTWHFYQISSVSHSNGKHESR
jgi:hypothetical protein